MTEPAQSQTLDPALLDPPKPPELLAEDRARKLRRDILNRLAESIGFAVSIIDQKGSKTFFVVNVPDDDIPTITTCNNVAELSKHILDKRIELQRLQATDPTRKFYMYVFRGERWLIQKGRVWTLVNDRQVLSLEGDITPQVDDSGSLSEKKILEQAVPYAPQLGEVDEEEAPQVFDIGANAGNPRPRLLGEDDDDVGDDEPAIIED